MLHIGVIKSSAITEIVRVVHHKPHIAKTRLPGYIFVANSMSLTSVNLTLMAPKSAV